MIWSHLEILTKFLSKTIKKSPSRLTGPKIICFGKIQRFSKEWVGHMQGPRKGWRDERWSNRGWLHQVEELVPVGFRAGAWPAPQCEHNHRARRRSTPPMCSKFFCPTPESSNKDLSSGVEAGQPPVVVGGTVMLVEENCWSMLFSSKWGLGPWGLQPASSSPSWYVSLDILLSASCMSSFPCSMLLSFMFLVPTPLRNRLGGEKWGSRPKSIWESLGGSAVG